MNVTIVSTNENKLLDRKEVKAEVKFDGPTPKRLQIKEGIGQKIAVNPELMVLRSVASGFGSKSVKVLAHCYATKELLMATEPTHIKVREGLMPKPEKKKAAAPAKKKE